MILRNMHLSRANALSEILHLLTRIFTTPLTCNLIYAQSYVIVIYTMNSIHNIVVYIIPIIVFVSLTILDIDQEARTL